MLLINNREVNSIIYRGGWSISFQWEHVFPSPSFYVSWIRGWEQQQHAQDTRSCSILPHKRLAMLSCRRSLSGCLLRECWNQSKISSSSFNPWESREVGEVGEGVEPHTASKTLLVMGVSSFDKCREGGSNSFENLAYTTRRSEVRALIKTYKTWRRLSIKTSSTVRLKWDAACPGKSCERLLVTELAHCPGLGQWLTSAPIAGNVTCSILVWSISESCGPFWEDMFWSLDNALKSKVLGEYFHMRRFPHLHRSTLFSRPHCSRQIK